MIIPMAFMPNYIAYPAGTDVSDGMTAQDTECPAPVKPMYLVQKVLLEVTLGTKITEES